MGIIHIANKSTKELVSTEYRNEAELEQYISQYPNLISKDDEKSLNFVKTQVPLPDSGILDLLLIDSEGRLIVVEIKLGRNIQSRREVVAQIFDYVSSLAQLSIDDIDDCTNGELDKVLRLSTNENDDETNYENRWQILRENLRAGMVRVVIVVDIVSDDLKRIMRFLNEHTDLDVRLVEVRKYSDSKDEIILVPNLVVAPEDKNSPNFRSHRPTSDIFQNVINSYMEKGDNKFPVIGRAPNYRIVKAENFPGGFHYEFVITKDFISVEIHIENEKYKGMEKILSNYPEKFKNEFENYKCEWDPKWSNKKGRFRILHPYVISSEIIALNMKKLIEKTYEEILPVLISMKDSENRPVG